MKSEAIPSATATDSPSESAPNPAPVRRRRDALVKAVPWLCFALVTFAAVCVFTPVGDWLGAPLVHVDELAKADSILVLGGDLGRGVEAARLYREGWAPRVVVSSNGEGLERLAAVVEAYGVPAEHILRDDKAFTTLDHGDTIARLPDIHPREQRFIIVTSPYHTSRSLACFRRAGYAKITMRSPGWETNGQFAGPVGWTMRARELPAKLYEILAWTKYKLRGWL